MPSRRICILGGTGFVGRHLAALLSESTHTLRIPTRHRERHRDLLILPPVQIIEANVHLPDTLNRLFEGCDTVINLVGILNERGRSGAGFQHAHVQLARKVIQSCANAGVRRLLHMSALGADARSGPSHYLRSKGEAEDLVHAAASETLAVTSFRPSVIFGPGDRFFNRFALLLRWTPLMFPLACAQSRFAPVYVGDVARAIYRTMDDDDTFGRRYDLCGPEIYTLKQLVEYAARCAALKRKVIALGDTLSRLQASALQWLPGKPFSPDNYRSLSRDSICADDGLRALGITPTHIDAVVPFYLTPRDARSKTDRYRKLAGR